MLCMITKVLNELIYQCHFSSPHVIFKEKIIIVALHHPCKDYCLNPAKNITNGLILCNKKFVAMHCKNII